MSQPIKIVLVDDVEQNLVALEASIARPGLELLKARSGADALELLLKHDVALALVDVQMPEMDGFELAELMRGSTRTRHVPIIFLTATDRSPMRTFRGYEAGAVDFLYKPLDPHILRSKIEVFVELHTQRMTLADQLDTLRHLVRTNEMFVAVLGHDLRNPLAAVLAGAELLNRSSHDERVVTTARRIRASGSRMARMIDQLLDLARMRTGQFGLSLASADAITIVQNIVAEFDTGNAANRIQVMHHGDTHGDFDCDRLAQVFSNLVGNALQHGTAGTPVLIKLDGSQQESISILIENAGVIEPRVVQRIFEPFHSESFEGGLRRASSRGGLGLGLYIANELVKLHSGRLEVKSSEQRGTVFEMTLPRHSAGGASQRTR